ncbi:uncharacterized protein LOC112171246 [Rosa chinensis]|uniref:uncharacterized protein LOC112171246 n=1 Tax=Rosa chinensis TaxID=74649 RepID=UPI000D097496|nr:uncharacterized protein LOC112171246 [Rosa chinensis]
MDRDRVSSSINSPPYFDGKDYSQWKVMMMAFLQSQEDKLWNIMEKGWIEPTINEAETSNLIPKPRGEWTVAEQSDHKCDTKARYSLFAALSDKERKRITNCPTAKASWELLQTTHEGNKKVKAQKLQSLVLEFEQMTMREDESIDDFHSRLINVTNQCHGLGDPILEHRIMKKFLRALPPSFEAKQIAIEEAQDFDTYSLDEFVGNLKTFESKRKKGQKEKTIALSTLKKEEDLSDFNLEEFALLTKQFKKILKSASESETQSDHEEENVALVGTTQNESSDESDDDEHSEKVASNKFEQLYKALKIMIGKIDELKDQLAVCEKEKSGIAEKLQSYKKKWEIERNALVSQVETLQENVNAQIRLVNSLTSEKITLEKSLGDSQEKFSKFSIGSDKVSKMIGMGKVDRDKKGLDFLSGESFSTKPTMFVKSKLLPKQSSTLEKSLKEFGRIAKLVAIPIKEKTVWAKKNKSFHPLASADFKPFDICGTDSEPSEMCLLSSFCFSHVEENYFIATCLVALTALSSRRADTWYLDSGCSRHMTGDKNWFSSFYDEVISGSVTFGDGKKAKVVGKGIVTAPSIPNLKNVLYVEGLQANLISVSQLSDDFEEVRFNKLRCLVLDGKGKSVMGGLRSKDHCYCVNANDSMSSQICLSSSSTEDTLNLWHRRLCHVNYQDLVKLSTKEGVRGLLKLSGKPSGMCEGCKLGKQTRSSHRITKFVSTSQPLDLMHMDFVGPIQTRSLGGKKYMLVLVDDFSRFTWVKFLSEKSDAFDNFQSLCKMILNEQYSSNRCIVRLRTDHGTEFENASFDKFCCEMGIKHEFSAPKTPQQNGVVERKNRVLIEMGTVMLNFANLAHTFWAEEISNACYTINRVIFRPGTEKTPYEVLKGKKPNVSHLRVFGNPCYIYRDREYLAKFDVKSDKGVFLGYSLNSRAYRVYNKRTCSVMETINVSIDDSIVLSHTPCISFDQVLFEREKDDDAAAAAEGQEDEEASEGIDDTSAIQPVYRTGQQQVHKDHSSSDIIGDVNDGLKTRRQAKKVVSNLSILSCFIAKHQEDISIITVYGFVSVIEPKNVKEALCDVNWINAMMNCVNLLEMMCGIWFLDWTLHMSLEQNGFSKTNLMKMVRLPATKQGLLLKGILKLKVLILMKPLPPCKA